jgi:hypothetical protein
MDDEVAAMIDCRRRAVAAGCKQTVIFEEPTEEATETVVAVEPIPSKCMITLKKHR